MMKYGKIVLVSAFAFCILMGARVMAQVSTDVLAGAEGLTKKVATSEKAAPDVKSLGYQMFIKKVPVFWADTEVIQPIVRMLANIASLFASGNDAIVAKLEGDILSSLGGEQPVPLYGDVTDHTATTGTIAGTTVEVAAAPLVSSVGVRANEYAGISVSSVTSLDELAVARQKEIASDAGDLDSQSQVSEQSKSNRQQRAVRYMADALAMKKLFSDLQKQVDSVQKMGDNTNFKAALQTNGGLRLTLDSLLTLKEQVMATRLRGRSETAVTSLPNSVKLPKIKSEMRN